MFNWIVKYYDENENDPSAGSHTGVRCRTYGGMRIYPPMADIIPYFEN